MKKFEKFIMVGILFAVIFLWGLNLGYPLQLLQNLRWTFLGYIFPVYYFFTVLPMILSAVLVLIFKRNWSKWELMWWLLPLICLPGILRSDDPVWSVRQWLSWMVRGVIPGGIIFLLMDFKKARSMGLYWIYPVVIAASLLGLVEIYSHHNPFFDIYYHPNLEDYHEVLVSQTSQPNNPFYRPTKYVLISSLPLGTQGNRIPYASAMVAFFPVGLWFLRYQKKFYFLPLLAVSVLFGTLLLAQVRSVWLGALVALVLLPIVGFHRNLREAAKIIAVVLISSGIFFVWPRTRGMLWNRFLSFHITETNIAARLGALQTAMVLKEYWFAGVGFGQFPAACKTYYHGFLPWSGTPDDQYLRWAIENGILSLGLLSAFFAGLIRTGWKKIQQMQDLKQADFYKALLAGWVSIAVSFLFFDGFYWGACNMTFWCFLGLYATCLTVSS